MTITGMCDHTVAHSPLIEDPDRNAIELLIDVPDVRWRGDPALPAAE